MSPHAGGRPVRPRHSCPCAAGDGGRRRLREGASGRPSTARRCGSTGKIPPTHRLDSGETRKCKAVDCPLCRQARAPRPDPAHSELPTSKALRFLPSGFRGCMQLNVVNWRGELTASEPITDLTAAPSVDGGSATLATFYPVQTSLPIDERLAKAPSKAEYKWWPDGYEPMYYILTPQVRSNAHTPDRASPAVLSKAGQCALRCVVWLLRWHFECSPWCLGRDPAIAGCVGGEAARRRRPHSVVAGEAALPPGAGNRGD